MSRIGKKPIPIPSGVTVSVQGQIVKVKGPKGENQQVLHERIKAVVENKNLIVQRLSDEPQDRSLHGLMRALLMNLVRGVTEGFEKDMELRGDTYKVAVKDKQLELQVGLSHIVLVKPPPQVEFKLLESKTKDNIKVIPIKISGIDKQKVGQIAAEIRSIRPPDSYKGKGVRYAGEYVRKKAGKVGVKTA